MYKHVKLLFQILQLIWLYNSQTNFLKQHIRPNYNFYWFIFWESKEKGGGRIWGHSADRRLNMLSFAPKEKSSS